MLGTSECLTMEAQADKSGQHFFYPGYPRASAKPPWKKHFTDLPQWWDNRKSKESGCSLLMQEVQASSCVFYRGPLLMNGLSEPSLEEIEEVSFYRGPLLMNSPCEPSLGKTEEVSFATSRNVLLVPEDHGKSSSLGHNPGCEPLSLSLENEPISLEDDSLPQPSIEELLCIVWKCKEAKSLVSALRLHAYMYKIGLEAHRSLGNRLVSMFVTVGSMSYAQKIFDTLVYKSESSWNSLINGYVKCGKPRRALALYENMQQISLPPSRHTFVALLKACTKLKDVERGNELHAEIAKHGLLRTDLFVGSTLVDMYAKC
eukprot:c24275_g6_i1 orf=480-1427(+)